MKPRLATLPCMRADWLVRCLSEPFLSAETLRDGRRTPPGPPPQIQSEINIVTQAGSTNMQRDFPPMHGGKRRPALAHIS